MGLDGGYVLCDGVPFPIGIACPTQPPDVDDAEAEPPPASSKPAPSPGVIAFGFVLAVCLALLCLFLRSVSRLGDPSSLRRNRSSSSSSSAAAGAGASSGPGPGPGLDKALLGKIKPATYDKVARKAAHVIKSSECAVCLCSFELPDAVRMLPHCKHAFHVACIDEWFASHSNCPICREDVAATCPPGTMSWSFTAAYHSRASSCADDDDPLHFQGFGKDVVTPAQSPHTIVDVHGPTIIGSANPTSSHHVAPLLTTISNFPVASSGASPLLRRSFSAGWNGHSLIDHMVANGPNRGDYQQGLLHDPITDRTLLIANKQEVGCRSTMRCRLLLH